MSAQPPANKLAGLIEKETEVSYEVFWRIKSVATCPVSGCVAQGNHHSTNDRFHRGLNAHFSGVNGKIVIDGV